MDANSQIRHILQSLENGLSYGQRIYTPDVFRINLRGIETVCHIFAPELYGAYCAAFNQICQDRWSHLKWLSPSLPPSSHYELNSIADMLAVSIHAWRQVLRELPHLNSGVNPLGPRAQIQRLIDYYELILLMSRPTTIDMTTILVRAVNHGVSTFGNWLSREYMIRSYDAQLDRGIKMDRTPLVEQLSAEGIDEQGIIYELLMLEIDAWSRVLKYIRLGE